MRWVMRWNRFSLMKVSLLGVGVGAELFRMLWALLVVFNEFTPTFLERKGA